MGVRLGLAKCSSVLRLSFLRDKRSVRRNALIAWPTRTLRAALRNIDVMNCPSTSLFTRFKPMRLRDLQPASENP